MNLNAKAAAFARPTPLSGVAAACPPPADDGGAQRANLSDLPTWANNDEARALLARIAEQQPDRTTPLTQTMTGGIGWFGYRGRDATQLRAMYAAFESERMDWIAECPFPSTEWSKRRQALIDYGRAHGADALITKVLKAAA